MKKRNVREYELSSPTEAEIAAGIQTIPAQVRVDQDSVTIGHAEEAIVFLSRRQAAEVHKILGDELLESEKTSVRIEE